MIPRPPESASSAGAGIGQIRVHSSSRSSSGGSIRSRRVLPASWQAVQWISVTRQANSGASGEMSLRWSAIRYRAPCRRRNAAMSNPAPGAGQHALGDRRVVHELRRASSGPSGPSRRSSRRARASAPASQPSPGGRAPAGSAPASRVSPLSVHRRTLRRSRPRSAAARAGRASAWRPARTRNRHLRCPWCGPRQSVPCPAASRRPGSGSRGPGRNGSLTWCGRRRCPAGRT